MNRLYLAFFRGSWDGNVQHCYISVVRGNRRAVKMAFMTSMVGETLGNRKAQADMTACESSFLVERQVYSL
jgi:ribosomal protein L35AE/L33A